MLLRQQTENRLEKQTNVLLDGLSAINDLAHRIKPSHPKEKVIFLSGVKKDSIHKKDFKFMEQNPYGDSDFDAEHNHRVIAEVDEWNDVMERKRDRDYKRKTQERTNAVTSYLTNISQGKGITDIERYFGRRYLAYLRGQQIVNQLKANPFLIEKIKRVMEKKGTLMPL